MRLAVVADVHYQVGDPPDSWHNAFERAGLLGRLEQPLHADVDAVVLLGDVTHAADPESIAAVDRLLAEAPVPVWSVPGNHDGPAPASVEGAALGLVGVGLSRPAGAFEGVLPDLTAWAERLLVVCSHYPLLETGERLTELGLKHPGDLTNRAHLERQLRERTLPTVVLCGHLHVRDACSSGAILQLAFGSLVEYPCEYSLVELVEDEGSFTVTRLALPLASEGPVDPRPATVAGTQRFAIDGANTWASR
jgi:predicted phosphodiesterase